MSADNPSWIAFAGSVVEVEWEGDQAEALVRFLFSRHLGPKPDREPDARFLVRPGKDQGCLLVYRDDELVFQGSEPAQQGEMLGAVVNRELAWHSRDGVLLHSAALAGDRGIVLLPGYPRAGKSTLTAWLLGQGLSYLTDELVFLPDAGDRIDCFTRPIPLDARSIQALGLKFDPARILGGQHGWIVDPEYLGTVGNGDLPAVEAVFPRYDPQRAGQGADIQSLTRAQIGLELMKVLVNARNVEGHGFSQASAQARGMTGHRLAYARFEDLAGFLDQIRERI